MKNIAIITLTKNPNYGNVLQNIALQKALEKIGCHSETIKNIYRSSLFTQKHGIKKKVKIFINVNEERIKEKRRKRFENYCNNNICYSLTYYDGYKIIGDIEHYDMFIAGSDQIWNPNFNLATNFELLNFVPYGKKMSYAASFGIDNLDSIDVGIKIRIRDALNSMPSVSLREIAGKDIVEDLVDTQCYVHLDPTLLLTVKEWDLVQYSPKFIVPVKYILVYMLGEIITEYSVTINKFAKRQDAKVINVLSDKYQNMDPSEFIWMIKNAECIFTDSFHASVFSILYHKTFYVLDRFDRFANQNSRFDSLFKICGLNNKIYKGNDKIFYQNIEWKKVDEKIQYHRQEAYEYLKTMIF
jgi:hypothetical protein